VSPTVIVVMGVSGAGKTTIGEALAVRLHCPFEDADALHPRANILKMAAGHPLDDADRAPWLAALRDWIASRLNTGQPAVLAASLLKRAYRDEVLAGDPRVALVYLRGDADLLRDRMKHRHGHFMPPHMLDSQLETLEPPDAGEGVIEVDVGGSVEETVEQVIKARPWPCFHSITLLARYRP
jgi:carbohydrate kinase (thermoresistant glucokinase family)